MGLNIPKKMRKLLISLFLGSIFTANADDAKPWTFWYWMNGAVTREGITADLEAMAEIGLEGCYLMPIYGVDQAPELGGTIRQGSPEWWQMVDFSLHEADRLGLKIGLHICDGFALAGGPWITPAQSMQVVVSRDTVIAVEKATKFDVAMLPAAPDGYFSDIAAYAIPLKYQPVTDDAKPTIESSSAEFSIDEKGRIKAKKACTFSYTYDAPVTVSALEISTFNNSMQALRMKVSYRDDEGNIRPLKQLVPPRHGWQNYDSPTTVALPTVTTRQLVFEWTPDGSESGSEDLDNAKWGKVLKIQEMKVLAAPRIDDWEGKSGRVWRVSSAEQSATSPAMYVPSAEIIMLANGTQLPKGDWRIVRIGHASTGHENATGGDCKGLECDKFSASATQSQLDHWFNEAFRKCDPTTARRVLKYMHIDSWECGCQNWSDSIPSANGGVQTFGQWFEARRGYSLTPYLPLMVGIPVDDCATSERVLRDIRATIAELIDTIFYPTLVANARRMDCQFSAESVAPTMVSDGMQHYRHADIPMGEFWLNSPTHDKPNDMLDAISGGHVYGKQIIQAEGFTELRGLFNEVPAQLKPLLDKQYCMGINRLFFHVYALNPDPTKKPGMTLNGIGLFFQRTQPWWPEGKDFVAYITRCQRLLQMGRPVVDIAVYTGHEMPRRSILPERIDIPSGYHYDSFNYDALLRDVKSDFRPTYRVLALPGARKMDPDHQPLPDDAREALAKITDMKVVEGIPSADELLKLGIAPDVIAPDGILFTHRALPYGDIYFFSNQQNEPRQFEVLLRDHHDREAVIYDAVTDTYSPLETKMLTKAQCFIQGYNSYVWECGYRLARISLPAYGSCFVLFGLKAGTSAATTEKVISANEIQPTNGYTLHFEENGIELKSDTLMDWTSATNDSIRYYSGRVRYTFDFKAKRDKKARQFLRLEGLSDVASVTLNGKACGSVWTEPYEIDVTDALQKGVNHIEIWVANSWNNAIVGHDTGHDPFANIWTNAKYRAPSPHLLTAGVERILLVEKK